MTVAVEPVCANCESWETKDWRLGFCEAVTEKLKQDEEINVQGLQTCQTLCGGTCGKFEPSAEAIREAAEAAEEETYMRGRAGIDYPASL